MKTKIICPLGSECEKSTDEGIERCAWFVQIQGVHPQTGDRIDESKCAMAWMPILQIETSKEVKGVAHAAESSRNVVADALQQSMPGLSQ